MTAPRRAAAAWTIVAALALVGVLLLLQGSASKAATTTADDDVPDFIQGYWYGRCDQWHPGETAPQEFRCARPRVIYALKDRIVWDRTYAPQNIQTDIAALVGWEQSG